MRTDVVVHMIDGGWSAPFPALDSPRTLVIAFCAPEVRDNPVPLKELEEAYPESIVIGCSTAGQIAGPDVLDGSVVAQIIAFEHTDLRQALVEGVTDSSRAGAALAGSLSDPDLAGAFVLSEGIDVNGSDLAEGIASVLGESVPVTGGLAGDGPDFVETWVWSDGRLMSHAIVAVGFYGSAVRIGYGSRGGWDIFGRERLVTRAENNVLYELDGKPALALYKEYLGDLAAGLPGKGLLFPLAINRDPEPPLVRTLLAIDEEANSITFAGNISEGSMVRLMRANFDRLVDGAENAALAAAEPDSPCAVIAISCVGRRMVLRHRVDEEAEAVLEHFPDDTVQAGFYSYGELSPFGSGACELYNQTMTVTALWERAGE